VLRLNDCLATSHTSYLCLSFKDHDTLCFAPLGAVVTVRGTDPPVQGRLVLIGRNKVRNSYPVYVGIMGISINKMKLLPLVDVVCPTFPFGPEGCAIVLHCFRATVRQPVEQTITGEVLTEFLARAFKDELPVPSPSLPASGSVAPRPTGSDWTYPFPQHHPLTPSVVTLYDGIQICLLMPEPHGANSLKIAFKSFGDSLQLDMKMRDNETQLLADAISRAGRAEDAKERAEGAKERALDLHLVAPKLEPVRTALKRKAALEISGQHLAKARRLGEKDGSPEIEDKELVLTVPKSKMRKASGFIKCPECAEASFESIGGVTTHVKQVHNKTLVIE
jgi:hypothetical protein